MAQSKGQKARAKTRGKPSVGQKARAGGGKPATKPKAQKAKADKG